MKIIITEDEIKIEIEAWETEEQLDVLEKNLDATQSECLPPEETQNLLVKS